MSALELARMNQASHLARLGRALLLMLLVAGTSSSARSASSTSMPYGTARPVAPAEFKAA